MKLTKRLKKFKYMDALDKTNTNLQCFVSQDGLVRQEFTHICFGRTIEQRRKEFVYTHNRHHPNNPITTLEVWQADNLSNAFLKTTVSDRVIAIMRSWGLFRNCTIERVSNKETAFKDSSARRIATNSKHLLKISFDYNTIKPQEVWLVGWVLRHLSCHPIAMLSFLKLVKKHPELSSWHLFLISFNINFGLKAIEVYCGHLLTTKSNLLLIRDVSIADVLKEIDKDMYKDMTKSLTYNIEKGIAERFSQMASSNAPPLYGTNLKTGREEIIFRKGSEPYSKELVQSFFSGEIFRKLYITGKYKESKKYAFNFVR